MLYIGNIFVQLSVHHKFSTALSIDFEIYFITCIWSFTYVSQCKKLKQDSSFSCKLNARLKFSVNVFSLNISKIK